MRTASAFVLTVRTCQSRKSLDELVLRLRLFALLKDRMSRSQPMDRDDLKKFVRAEFAKLDTEMINRYVRSYKARPEAIKAADAASMKPSAHK